MRSTSVQDFGRRDGRVARLQAVVIHSCLAMFVLLALEGEKLLASGGSVGLGSLLGPIGGGVGGAIVAIGCALLVVGRWRFLPFKVWLAFCSAAYGVLLLIWAINTRYFLATGLSLDWELLRYSIEHASFMGGIVSEGLDSRLLLTVGIVVLTGVLALSWSRKPLFSVSTNPSVIELALLGFSLLVFISSSQGITKAFARDGGGSLVHFLSTGGRAYGFRPYDAPAVVSTEEEEKPNVVVIVLESIRADALSVDEQAMSGTKTPALDALAERGRRAPETYTAVTHTSKALVGILCGAFPRLVMDIVEAEEGGLPLACLPKLLGEQGYKARFIQSADGAFENRHGLVKNMGFDEWKTREHLDGVEAGYLGMDDMAMMDPVAEWLEDDDDRPFFLTILTSVSHHPYELPGVDHPSNTLEAYLDSVAYVDGFVGEVVSLIEEKAPNTLFVVVGDHGQAFSEHARLGHNAVPYEEGVRVPLILYGPWPNLTEPLIGGLRHQVDIMPTVLEAIGAEWRGQLPGFSLSLDAGHPFVISSCWFRQLCSVLRLGDLKFIYHYDRAPMELYDLSTDPKELEDLASRRSAAVIMAAKARLREVETNIEDVYIR